MNAVQIYFTYTDTGTMHINEKGAKEIELIVVKVKRNKVSFCHTLTLPCLCENYCNFTKLCYCSIKAVIIFKFGLLKFWQP